MVASAPLLRSWRVRASIAAAITLTGCLAVPAGWAVVKTAEAGQGEPTPVAAANAYLLATFASSDGLGIDRCVCSGRPRRALKTAQELRREFEAHAGDGVKVESFDWRESSSTGLVSAMVGFRFTRVDPETGSVTFISGTKHEWRFHTMREQGISGGWKVCRVEAPALCGTHIRC